MKKVLKTLVLLLIVLFPLKIYAAGGHINASKSSLSIEEGKTTTFTITAYNAIGDVTIVSNNTGIATVSQGFWETGMVGEEETKTGTITVTGVSTGSTTITLTIDGATFDGTDLSGNTITINVMVVEKPAPTPSTPGTNTPTQVDNRSKNNNLKSISVDGFSLVKVDSNNYTLSVNNNVESIKINVEAEDSKAKVSGAGEHKLQVGENNIEIIITAESGAQNKINVKVTRKDAYYLDDYEAALADITDGEVPIIIKDDSKITVEQLNKIKSSKKTVDFNYYDENKRLLYSWIINGVELANIREITTTVKFDPSNDSIYKLSNYADGVYIDFTHSGELPIGTKIKLYVGDKYKDGNRINVYYYNTTKNDLELIADNLLVTKGYIEFELEHCSKYFLTMSNISGISITNSSNEKLFMIIAIVEFVVIVILLFTKKNKKKEKKSNLANDTNDTKNVEKNEEVIEEQPAEEVAEQPQYEEQPAEEVVEQPQYEEQPTEYAAAEPQYEEQPTEYATEEPQYEEQPTEYAAEEPQYEEQPTEYVAEEPQYEEQPTEYAAAEPQYEEQPTEQEYIDDSQPYDLELASGETSSTDKNI